MSNESKAHLFAMKRIRDMLEDTLHDLGKGAIRFDRELVTQVKFRLETIVEDYEKGVEE